MQLNMVASVLDMSLYGTISVSTKGETMVIPDGHVRFKIV